MCKKFHKLRFSNPLMQIWTDAVCSLSQETEETVLHLVGECSTLSAKRVSILRSQYLSYEELGNVHWRAILWHRHIFLVSVATCYIKLYFMIERILTNSAKKSYTSTMKMLQLKHGDVQHTGKNPISSAANHSDPTVPEVVVRKTPSLLSLFNACTTLLFQEVDTSTGAQTTCGDVASLLHN